jgi:hypothetical protein
MGMCGPVERELRERYKMMEETLGDIPLFQGIKEKAFGALAPINAPMRISGYQPGCSSISSYP